MADFAAVFKFACGKRAAEIAGQLLVFLKDFTGCRSSTFCLTAKHAGSEVCYVSFSISYVLNNLPLDRTSLPLSHKKTPPENTSSQRRYLLLSAVLRPETLRGRQFHCGFQTPLLIPCCLPKRHFHEFCRKAKSRQGGTNGGELYLLDKTEYPFARVFAATKTRRKHLHLWHWQVFLIRNA